MKIIISMKYQKAINHFFKNLNLIIKKLKV